MDDCDIFLFQEFHEFGELFSLFSCCSFLVVVAFMSSNFLYRWSSDCFMSELSESRCFGAMVVGGIEMLLGSDGGKSSNDAVGMAL